MLNVPAIARIAYAAFAEIRQMQGHPHVPWSLASDTERDLVMQSVLFLVENPEAKQEDLFNALTSMGDYPPYSEAPEDVRLPFAILVALTRGALDAAITS